ncbi:MAG: hypothetical protein ACLR8Y_16830 [Alistipes indistinctus]
MSIAKTFPIPPSNISLFGDITTTGFWLLGVRGNTLFKGAKYRLDFTTYFFSFPSALLAGIGCDKGMYGTPGSYKRMQSQVKVDFFFRLVPKFYLGPSVSFNYIKGKDFSDISLLNGENTQYTNTSIGVILMYDSRDVIYTMPRGVFMRVWINVSTRRFR